VSLDRSGLLANIVGMPKENITVSATCGQPFRFLVIIEGGGADGMGEVFLDWSHGCSLVVDLDEFFRWVLISLKKLIISCDIDIFSLLVGNNSV